MSKALLKASSFILKPLHCTDFEFIFRCAAKLLDLDLEWGDGEEHHYLSHLSSMLVKGSLIYRGCSSVMHALKAYTIKPQV